MNLQKLFEIQKVLDQRIVKEHELENRYLLPEKVLALQVELGELANEWRGFKFWSNKPASPKESILGEYVDGLHFILSIGLELEFDFELPVLAIEPIQCSDITQQFSYLFAADWEIYEPGDGAYYHEGLELFIGLGWMLGFTWEEIEQAYMKKNEVNHQRQDNGY
jgi:dimeric dUTPase (all-alpha-NTP-PPase superfamily)